MSYRDNFPHSADWFDKALQHMPGGVSSPVRSFKGVGGSPLFMEKGQGAWVQDVDGNRYLDFCLSWGPLILGHAHPTIIEIVQKVSQNGLTFGTPTPWEVRLSEKICDAVPEVEQVRFVSSGTEALMSAVRLGRAVTGRDKILKFDGGYHGHADSFLVKAGSGLKTLGTASSPGVTASTASDTLVCSFNDRDELDSIMEKWGDELGVVVIEPLPGNFGMIPLDKDFCESLMNWKSKKGFLLLSDEVITGFRLQYGILAPTLGLEPDLVTLGKIIGGGMPVGAYGGSRSLMKNIAPEGSVYQAGTLSGNPVAMAAGWQTLTLLQEEDPYGSLDSLGQWFSDEMKSISQKHQTPFQSVQRGSLLWNYFGETLKPSGGGTSDDDAMSRFSQIHEKLLGKGFYLPPSGWEVLFLSTAHTKADLELFLEAFDASLSELK